MENQIKIMKIKENAKIPVCATKGSAGMDLYACISEPITLEAGESVLVPTGIAIALPNEDCAAFVFARSGLAINHGIGLSNGVGVVDSDYRGEICVGLCNLSSEPYTIMPDDRIAQMVIMPVLNFLISEVDSLDDTQRSSGGFGSTGKR
ncbi:MAG: dUTP diphosphatase [Bacillota bacterium]|nr:dUTP diphosphatase [Bacillota bacterium]